MRQIRGPESRDAEPVEIPLTHEARVTIGREPGRHAERVGIVVLGLVLLAFMKPWGKPPEPEPGAAPAARVQPSHTAQPATPEQACVGSWWSIEVDEEHGGVARAWVLTEAVEAIGPTDARIRFVTVAARQVDSLGFCPAARDAASGASATFFRLDPAPTPFGTTAVRMPPEPDVPANTLYQPRQLATTGSGTPRAPWPAGRYVIRIDGPDGYQRWLGVDVRLVPVAGGLGPTPLD